MCSLFFVVFRCDRLIGIVVFVIEPFILDIHVVGKIQYFAFECMSFENHTESQLVFGSIAPSSSTSSSCVL